MLLNTTVEVFGIEFDIEFEHTPEQKEVRHEANGDPGCEGLPEEIEIVGIEHKGVDFSEFFLEYNWENVVRNNFWEKDGKGSYRKNTDITHTHKMLDMFYDEMENNRES